MKLTLIGYGFVGKAVYNVLNKKYDVRIVDPQFNNKTITDDSDGYIVCVPTPENENGSCDMSIVYGVIHECPDDTPILIKSTISLEGWYELRKHTNKRITFSPEFLTAANANQDFENQEYMMFGGIDTRFWFDVFEVKPIFADVEELILAKYFRNAFLATKVAFFNEAYNFCIENNLDYNKISELVGMDKRITKSHMQVPGPDGKLGFGGACFPKDTNALLDTGYMYNSPFHILYEVVEANERQRC